MTTTGGSDAAAAPPAAGSGSIANPTYWWYRARSELMEIVFAASLTSEARVLDVGSADGPSVAWIDQRARRTAVDIDPSGLGANGVCASAHLLPFADGGFDAVAAFDVIEHFPDEDLIVAELGRVVRPGGRLLVSVPAYQWAWTAFDLNAGHHRRYTRRRIVRALRRHGFRIDRATYAFAGTFPMFAADRLRARVLRRSPERVRESRLPGRLERLLLGLCRIDARLLRRVNLPFGSSVFVAARRG